MIRRQRACRVRCDRWWVQTSHIGPKQTESNTKRTRPPFDQVALATASLGHGKSVPFLHIELYRHKFNARVNRNAGIFKVIFKHFLMIFTGIICVAAGVTPYRRDRGRVRERLRPDEASHRSCETIPAPMRCESVHQSFNPDVLYFVADDSRYHTVTKSYMYKLTTVLVFFQSLN